MALMTFLYFDTDMNIFLLANLLISILVQSEIVEIDFNCSIV